jgi:anti-sigma B factor antagonist
LAQATSRLDSRDFPDILVTAGWCLVTATGDIDLATAPELSRVLQAAIPAQQPERHLILDLAAVNFIDCSGLRLLVQTRHRLADRFWLANPPRQVRWLLGLTGLTDTFAVLDGLPPITRVPRRRSVRR